MVAVQYHITLRVTQRGLKWLQGRELVNSHDCCVLLYLLLVVLIGHVQNNHPIAERAHGDAC